MVQQGSSTPGSSAAGSFLSPASPASPSPAVLFPFPGEPAPDEIPVPGETPAPPVLLLGDAGLRRTAELCAHSNAFPFGSPALKTVETELHARLDAFRSEHGFGRGIAAPQIGRPVRMVACNLSGMG